MLLFFKGLSTYLYPFFDEQLHIHMVRCWESTLQNERVSNIDDKHNVRRSEALLFIHGNAHSAHRGRSRSEHLHRLRHSSFQFVLHLYFLDIFWNSDSDAIL